MGKYTWLIEPGHGGIIDGQYQTSTKWRKRSYFKNGELLNPKKHNLEWLEANNDLKYYEGVGNRGIARHLMNLMEKHKVRYYDVTDGSQLDLSLKYRVDKANEYYRTDKTCIYLSIHSDAFNVESAQGFSVSCLLKKTDIRCNF